MISGLNICKSGNEPKVGQVKTFVINGDRIKSKPADQGGISYVITKVTPRESYKDSYGNLGFDLELGANTGPQSTQDAPQRAFIPNQGDDRGNRIERQHSQHMAILTVGILMSNGMISTPEDMKTKLKELTDYYQRDVSKSPVKDEF